MFITNLTRNAWQSVAYSPLVVSPLASTYETHPIKPQCLTAPPSSERRLTKRGKIIDAGHTNSYVLNSGITEPNLKKFPHNVQK